MKKTIPGEIYNKLREQFKKGGKMLSVICKHFNRVEILNELDKCKSARINDVRVCERHKKLSFIVLSETSEIKNTKRKVNKI
ncbi:hypothetical protein GW796_07660 [archaeon]|nr:hypothetical protein [archaeon]